MSLDPIDDFILPTNQAYDRPRGSCLLLWTSLRLLDYCISFVLIEKQSLLRLVLFFFSNFIVIEACTCDTSSEMVLAYDYVPYTLSFTILIVLLLYLPHYFVVIWLGSLVSMDLRQVSSHSILDRA